MKRINKTKIVEKVKKINKAKIIYMMTLMKILETIIDSQNNHLSATNEMFEILI